MNFEQILKRKYQQKRDDFNDNKTNRSQIQFKQFLSDGFQKFWDKK